MSQFTGMSGVKMLANKFMRDVFNAANKLKFVRIETLDNGTQAMTVTTVSFKPTNDAQQMDLIVSYRVYFESLKKSKGARAGSGFARVTEIDGLPIVSSVVVLKNTSDEYMFAIKAAHEAKKNHARAYNFALKQADKMENVVGYSELSYTEAKDFMGRMARAKVRAANPILQKTAEEFAALEAAQLAEIEAMIAAETN